MTENPNVPPSYQTVRDHDTNRQTSDRSIDVLDNRADNPTYLPYSLSVTKQMISDFETSTGLLGIGKKMLAAGFWRLS